MQVKELKEAKERIIILEDVIDHKQLTIKNLQQKLGQVHREIKGRLSALNIAVRLVEKSHPLYLILRLFSIFVSYGPKSFLCRVSQHPSEI